MLGPRADSAEAYCALGVIAAIRSLNHEAEQAFRKAIMLKPDYHWARYCLGVVLTGAGRHSEAVAELDAAARGLPGNLRIARVLRNLGTLHLKAGQYDEAIAALERAVSIDPSHPTTFRKLAFAYLGSGDEAKAEESMRRAMEMEAGS